MPQTIQIETQPEQQGLAHLRAQRAAGRASRELALHRTEQTLDQRSAPVEPSWKCSPHLRTHSVDAPGFLAALGGDHALRPKLAPDVGVISLAVELRIGQHQADARLLRRRLDY